MTSAVCLTGKYNNNNHAGTNAASRMCFPFGETAEVVRTVPPPALLCAKQVAQDVSCQKLSEQTRHAVKQTPSARVQNVRASGKTRNSARERISVICLYFLPSCCRSPRVPVTQDRLQVHHQSPASSAEGTQLRSDWGKVSRTGGGLLLLLLLLRRHRHSGHLRHACIRCPKPSTRSFFCCVQGETARGVLWVCK